MSIAARPAAASGCVACCARTRGATCEARVFQASHSQQVVYIQDTTIAGNLLVVIKGGAGAGSVMDGNIVLVNVEIANNSMSFFPGTNLFEELGGGALFVSSSSVQGLGCRFNGNLVLSSCMPSLALDVSSHRPSGEGCVWRWRHSRYGIYHRVGVLSGVLQHRHNRWRRRGPCHIRVLPQPDGLRSGRQLRRLLRRWHRRVWHIRLVEDTGVRIPLHGKCRRHRLRRVLSGELCLFVQCRDTCGAHQGSPHRCDHAQIIGTGNQVLNIQGAQSIDFTFDEIASTLPGYECTLQTLQGFQVSLVKAQQVSTVLPCSPVTGAGHQGPIPSFG